jgi:dTDP-4-dehydrorhamnose 3,5-epimerase|tara:strand:- start:1976 stop:2524 length:549 start_codon:yes stop_codon:yes gene_type:complete
MKHSKLKIETEIDGVFLLKLPYYTDKRGVFCKIYNFEYSKNLGLPFLCHESFFTISMANVIRGMHFQIYPHEQYKIASVVSGKIIDVVLDLRKESNTYGNHLTFELSNNNARAIFISPGIAHGFCSLEDNTIVNYIVSSVYAPEHDLGIHWNSFGYKWPVTNPILSDRDSQHPSFSDFETMF